MKKIAIITARGGSKRIPKKNIKEFLGKPIIAYSIETAINSSLFDEVMVSTDSEEIASIAKKYGASVPFFRSKETSNDYATTTDVLKEVLKKYQDLDKMFDIACCIYPTSPFITSTKLNDAYKLLKKNNFDSVMPVTTFSFPPLRGMVIEDNKLSFKWPEYSQKRSQDLEKIYHDCGQFYMFKVDKFLETNKLVTDNTGAIIVDELEVQDIDNLTDWKLAEIKYKMMEDNNED